MITKPERELMDQETVLQVGFQQVGRLAVAERLKELDLKLSPKLPLQGFNNKARFLAVTLLKASVRSRQPTQTGSLSKV
jgi:hypothetical protein